jgi:hypothetical protein
LRAILSACFLPQKSSRSWFDLDSLFGLSRKGKHDTSFPMSPMPKYASLPSHAQSSQMFSGHGVPWSSQLHAKSPSQSVGNTLSGITTSSEVKWMSAQREMSLQKAAEEMVSAAMHKHQLQTAGVLPSDGQQPSTAILMNAGHSVPMQSLAATPNLNVMTSAAAFSPRVPVATQLSSPLIHQPVMMSRPMMTVPQPQFTMTQPVFTQPPPVPVQPVFQAPMPRMMQQPLALPPHQPVAIHAPHPNLVPSPTHYSPPSPVSTTAEQPKQHDPMPSSDGEAPTVTPGHWVFVPQGAPTIAANAVTPTTVPKSPKAKLRRSKSSSSRGSPRKSKDTGMLSGQRVI